MNKELEDKLVDKILEHLEKYPIETWEENYEGFSYAREYMSPSKRLMISDSELDYVTVRLDSNGDRNYEWFTVDNDKLSKIIKTENERRRENILLKVHEKQRQTLEKFLAEDF